MRYDPKPIDTGNVELAADIQPLIERLAEHNHDLWAKQRIDTGWKYGKERNDQRQENPCLVSYSELPESEKDVDRNAVIGTLLIGTILNAMTILDVSYYGQNFIKGVVLLLAVLSDSIINPRNEETAQQGDI